MQLPDPRPYFSELADPRRETRNKLHKLQDIVMIVLCAAISDQIDGLEYKPQWADLKAVRMVECIREIGDKVSIQRRYYLLPCRKTMSACDLY